MEYADAGRATVAPSGYLASGQPPGHQAEQQPNPGGPPRRHARGSRTRGRQQVGDVRTVSLENADAGETAGELGNALAILTMKIASTGTGERGDSSAAGPTPILPRQPSST
jgi:hypothetical protein